MTWIKVTCPTCGRYLGEIKEGTEVLCNKCNKWIKAEKGSASSAGKKRRSRKT